MSSWYVVRTGMWSSLNNNTAMIQADSHMEAGIMALKTNVFPWAVGQEIEVWEVEEEPTKFTAQSTVELTRKPTPKTKP